MNRVTFLDRGEGLIEVGIPNYHGFTYTNKVEILDKIKDYTSIFVDLENLEYPGSLIVELIFDIVIHCKADPLKKVVFSFKQTIYSKILYNALKSLCSEDEQITIRFRGIKND
jgi:hypothetical protein